MSFIEKNYLLSKISDGEIYVNLVNISKSGLTRKLRFYIVNENGILNVTDLISNLSGNKLDKNGNLVVKGAGMDMIFHILNSICRKNNKEYNGNYKLL